MGNLTSISYRVKSFNSRIYASGFHPDGSQTVGYRLDTLTIEVYDYVTIKRVNGTTDFQVLEFLNQNRSFKLETDKTLEISYCVTNLTGLHGCARLIDKVYYSDGSLANTNRIRVTPTGTLCNSPNFLQGSILMGGYDINFINSNNIVQGMRCVLSVTDVPPNDDRMKRCCTMRDVIEYKTQNVIPTIVPNFATFDELINWSNTDYLSYDCPAVFLNGFETTHCDYYMNTYCATNILTAECQVWLLKSVKNGRRQALNLYSEYCSTNLSNSVCLMFTLIANQYGYESYSDKSLREYCDNNVDSNCECYNMSKNPNMISISAFIGPLECWYKGCAEQPNIQFLNSSQINQKRKCKINVCDININTINAPNAVVNIVNSCSGNVENNITQENSLVEKRDKMPIILPIATSCLLAGLVVFLGRM